jgi:hypothetical protein
MKVAPCNGTGGRSHPIACEHRFPRHARRGASNMVCPVTHQRF